MKKKTTAGLISIVAIVAVTMYASGVIYSTSSIDSKITDNNIQKFFTNNLQLPEFIGVASAVSDEDFGIPEDWYDETAELRG